MSPRAGKFNNISHIVWIRHMLRRWRRKAAASSPVLRITDGRVPSDVPAGHLAVCVGSSRRRFVVKASYLNHPTFQKLLIEAEEEYGYANHGPLFIPCEESVFEQIIQSLSGEGAPFEDSQRGCHVDCRMTDLDFVVESPPLVGGYSNNTVC